MHVQRGSISHMSILLAHGECRYCPITQEGHGAPHYLVSPEPQSMCLQTPTDNNQPLAEEVFVCAGIAILAAGTSTVSLCEDENRGTSPASRDTRPPGNNKHLYKWKEYSEKAAKHHEEVQSTVNEPATCTSVSPSDHSEMCQLLQNGRIVTPSNGCYI